MALTKAELQANKVYWAKKSGDNFYQYLLLVRGGTPFLYVSKVVFIPTNSNPGIPAEVHLNTIDDFEDAFENSNWPGNSS